MGYNLTVHKNSSKITYWYPISQIRIRKILDCNYNTLFPNKKQQIIYILPEEYRLT
jgi:hypothetical protein